MYLPDHSLDGFEISWYSIHFYCSTTHLQTQQYPVAIRRLQAGRSFSVPIHARRLSSKISKTHSVFSWMNSDEAFGYFGYCHAFPPIKLLQLGANICQTLLYYVREGRWKVVIEERQIRPKPRNWKKIEEWSAVHQCPSVFSLKMNGSLEIQHLDRTLWCIFSESIHIQQISTVPLVSTSKSPKFWLRGFHTSRFIRFNRFTCLRCVDWSSVQSHNSSIAGAPKSHTIGLEHHEIKRFSLSMLVILDISSNNLITPSICINGAAFALQLQTKQFEHTKSENHSQSFIFLSLSTQISVHFLPFQTGDTQTRCWWTCSAERLEADAKKRGWIRWLMDKIQRTRLFCILTCSIPTGAGVCRSTIPCKVRSFSRKNISVITRSYCCGRWSA